MDKRSFKGRYSLVFATIISFLSVCTAGVSTFAWFQAQANVNVRAAETSTTITVSKPDTFELGAATIYAYNFNGTSGYTSSASGSIANGSVSNFTEITSSNKATLLNVSGLAPGCKMSFGIKIQVPSAIAAASLTLKEYQTRNNTYRKVISSLASVGSESGTTGTLSDSIVFIEDIVNLYGSINSTGTFALGTEKSMVSDFHCSKTFDSNDVGYTSSTFDNLDYEIVKNNSLSVAANGYVYIFYTIGFSNSGLYSEYTFNSTNRKYYPCHSVISSDLAGYRYFYPNPDGGNSSCYSKLSFSLKELGVTVSEYSL